MPSRDIVITWPQKKSLADYVATLDEAFTYSEVINYRVARLPVWTNAIEDHGFRGWAFGIARPRCYVVHTGYVRGWTEVVGTCWRDDIEGFPPGNFIVRSPNWNPIVNGPAMGSFRGWRWYPPA